MRRTTRATPDSSSYLEQLERRDEQDEVVIDPSALASALEKLHRHREPEVAFTAYNLKRMLNILGGRKQHVSPAGHLSPLPPTMT